MSERSSSMAGLMITSEAMASFSQHRSFRCVPRPGSVTVDILEVMTDQPAERPTDPTIEPDTKDWTWVLQRPCTECGFDARSVRGEEIKNRVYSNARAWQRVLEHPGARTRPS